MIKMTDFESKTNKNIIRYMEEKIDAEILDDNGMLPWVVAILYDEFSLEDRKAIAKKYVDEGGWFAVVHQTSSENEERPGLTVFHLFTKKSWGIWWHTYGYDMDYLNKLHIYKVME